ncbi:hypothetical protein [Zobellella aerophila]|uniref:Phospholipase/carboxylesterase n=1 Tax=Zobellella aerophila TaxID=870480 RepID=A0ABP6VH29_9GAMM
MNASFGSLVAATDLGLAHRVLHPRAAGQGKSPCLILLHGVGGNEAGLIDFGLRQNPRLTVILARGPLVFGPAQFGWFSVQFTANGPQIKPDEAEHARQLLVHFLAQLPDTYGVDPDNLWIAGFSQGGIMSASVALTRPELVGGFGVLSGRILPEIAPLIAGEQQLSELQALVCHGRQDGKLPVSMAHASRALLAQHKVPLTYREYDAVHELSPQMQADFVDWLATRI